MCSTQLFLWGQNLSEFFRIVSTNNFGCLSNVVFCGQGYFIGIWIDNEDGCKTVNSLVAMCWMAANGVLSNLTTANWFISGFAWISPFRYNCEAYVRIFTK